MADFRIVFTCLTCSDLNRNEAENRSDLGTELFTFTDAVGHVIETRNDYGFAHWVDAEVVATEVK